jgi:ketosteroid isomerase-like protein
VTIYQEHPTGPMKVRDPEDIDRVVAALRVFSSGNMTKWDAISGIYCETSKTIDPDGKLLEGYDGIKEAWSAWASRKRYTHGWADKTIMLSDDVALRFYKYPNCGEDDNGEPWDFMCDGFWVAQRQPDESWAVLIDVPFCRNPETIGSRKMVSPWDGLLEPLSGDPRIIEDQLVTPLMASLEEAGSEEDCSLCQTIKKLKYGRTSESAAKVTCRPGYIVPNRPPAEPSPVFYEDDTCWVAECEFCATPMVVAKSHNTTPSDSDAKAMNDRLLQVVAEQYGYESWLDDKNLRIKDHYHVHARPLDRLTGHAYARPAVPIR